MTRLIGALRIMSRDELCLNSLLIREVNTNDGHNKMISTSNHVETHHTFVLCHLFLSNCSLSIRERRCQFSPVCTSPGVTQHLSEMSLVLWCPLLCSLTDCRHCRQKQFQQKHKGFALNAWHNLNYVCQWGCQNVTFTADYNSNMNQWPDKYFF